MTLLTTTDACQAHVSHHAPVPLLMEKHHILPQGWQATWSPGGDTSRLFDARTVTLCPTAHRNVHVWIPRMMQIVQRIGEQPVEDVLAATRREHNIRRPTGEFLWAAQALIRWRLVGGKLMTLVGAGEWGYGLAGPS